MRKGCTCWYVDQMKRNRRRKEKEERIDRALDAVCIGAVVVVYVSTLLHILLSSI